MITVLSKEDYAPIDRYSTPDVILCRKHADNRDFHPRTKLSKALVTDASKLEWRSRAELQAKYGVVLRTGTEVTAIDVANKVAVIGSSNERVAYETLVLASGGTPRQLPIEGKDLGNIFTLRGVSDAKVIDAGQWFRPLWALN